VKFSELNLNPQILEAISFMNYDTATLIQEQAIPQILNGNDLIACAQTGTGKTAAFILPILSKLANVKKNKTCVLIIVPTRELAVQIDTQIQGFSYFVDAESFAVYGGGDGLDWEYQKKALNQGTKIIVATPGKLLAHLDFGYVKFDEIEYLILDEADRMLDMGFLDDIIRISSFLPKKRQTLMFSATMPPKIRTLAKTLLNNPFEINISLSKPAEGVLQAVYLTHNNQKTRLIDHLLRNNEDYQSILIFTSTKLKVFEIVESLKSKKYNVGGISSDLEQNERELVLQNFKSKKTRILVATDVLSRGIDIKDVNLVINFDVPGDAEDYVHRVGRTARAETTGVALTLVNEDDMNKFANIEKLIDTEIIKLKVPIEIGESPVWNVNKKKEIFRKRKSFKKVGSSHKK